MHITYCSCDISECVHLSGRPLQEFAEGHRIRPYFWSAHLVVFILSLVSRTSCKNEEQIISQQTERRHSRQCPPSTYTKFVWSREQKTYLRSIIRPCWTHMLSSLYSLSTPLSLPSYRIMIYSQMWNYPLFLSGEKVLDKKSYYELREKTL